MTVVGSAWVEIKPLTTGFGPEAEAQVKRALAGVKGEIELQLDESGFRQKAQAAVTAALAGVTADIELDVDTVGLRQRIELAVAGVRSEIELDVDILSLRRRIDAALSGIRSRIDLDVNGAALRAAVQAATAGVKLTLDVNITALRAAVRAAVQGVKVELDVNKTALRAAIRSAAQGVKVELDVNITALRAAIRNAGRGLRIDLDFDIDVGLLRARIAAAIRAAQAGQNVNVGVGTSGFGGAGAAGFSGGLRSLLAGLAIPALDALIGLLAAATGGFVAAAGGALAFASSLGSIVGAAAAIPSAIGAAVQSALSIGLAFGGVGDALKAATAAEKALTTESVGGGASSVASARAVEAAKRGVAEAERQAAVAAEQASRRIEDAERGLGDARREAAEAAERAARRISDAERGVSDAQREQLDAQEDLTRARREAIEELEDLRLSVERLALSEAQARERLRVARIEAELAQRREFGDLQGLSTENFNQLRDALLRGSDATDAVLDLRDAELDLQEVLERQADAREALAEAERRGVEGSDAMVAARERERQASEQLMLAQRDLADAQRDSLRSQEDAQRRLFLAQRELSDAQRDSARSQDDSARRIQEAQERVAEALEGVAGGASAAEGAVDRYQAALDRLGPSQRRFAEFLVSLRPTIRDLQETVAAGLFPGLEEGIRRALPLVEDFKPILFDTGEAIGDLTVALSDLVTSPAFRVDLYRIGRGNIDVIRVLGEAGLAAVSALRHLTVAGQPLALRLSEITRSLAGVVDSQLLLARADGRLDAYFERVGDRIENVLLVLGFLGSALLDVFREATPEGDRYLEKLVNISARFDILVERARARGAISGFFEEGRPAAEEFGRLLAAIVESLVRVGRENFGTFITVSQAIRLELLPALERLSAVLDGQTIASFVALTTNAIDLYTVLIAGNPVVRAFVEGLSDVLGFIRFLATEIPVLSPLLVALVGGMIALRGAIALFRLTAFLLGFQTLAAILPAVSAGLASIVGTLIVLGTRMGLTTMIAGYLATALVGVGLAAVGVLALKLIFDQLAPSVEKSVRAIVSARDPLAEFEAQQRKAANPGFFDVFTAKMKALLGGDLKTAFTLSIEDMKVFNVKAAELFRETAEASTAQAQRIIDDLKKRGIATDEYERILQDVINTTVLHGVAEEEVARKVQAARDAMREKNVVIDEQIVKLRELHGHQLNQFDAETRLAEASDRLKKSLQDTGFATGDLTGAFNANTEAGRANRDALSNLYRKIQDSIDVVVESARQGHLDAEGKQAILNKLRELETSGYPGATTQAALFKQQLDKVQGLYEATIVVNARQAQLELDALINKAVTAMGAINTISSADKEAIRRYVESGGGSGGGGGGGTGLDGFALGGRVRKGVAYIVGEKRPELFVPDENGTIYPTVPPVREGVQNQVMAAVDQMQVQVAMDIIPRLAPIEGPAGAAALTSSTGRIEDALRQLERSLSRSLAAQSQAPRTTTIENHFHLPSGDPESVAAAVERRLTWQFGAPAEPGI